MKRKKILLVDDSETILMLEQMILKDRPYDIITANDGKEGVAKAEAEKPDLILMDVVMWTMSGFEACRQIRKKEATKDIPIILVTSEAGTENIQTGFDSGCTDYISKPIKGPELLSRVEKYLAEEGSRPRNGRGEQ